MLTGRQWTAGSEIEYRVEENARASQRDAAGMRLNAASDGPQPNAAPLHAMLKQRDREHPTAPATTTPPRHTAPAHATAAMAPPMHRRKRAPRLAAIRLRTSRCHAPITAPIERTDRCISCARLQQVARHSASRRHRAADHARHQGGEHIGSMASASSHARTMRG